MAHGWNPYFQSLPPLSSDPGTRRGTSESDGTLPQHTENFPVHRGFSGTTVSREAPASHPRFNANYCTNPSIENSRLDCVYERYCETQWQASGEQLEKDYLPRCGNNNFPNFATDGLPASEPFHSSFTPDLNGLKQNCEMLSASCVENYSPVSNSSETAANEERPSCKFTGSDSFPKQKTEIVSDDGSTDFFFNDTGNGNFQTDSLCSTSSETNVFSIKTYAGHDQSSSTSFMTTAARSDTVHNGDNYDGFQDQKQKEDMERNLKEGEYPDFLMTGTLAEDRIDQYPVDTEEDDELKSVAPALFDNGKNRITEKIGNEVRDESKGVKNPDATDEQQKVLTENVQDKNWTLESLREESHSFDGNISDDQKTPENSNSTNCENEITKPDSQDMENQNDVSQSSNHEELKESNFRDMDRELSQCPSTSSGHDIEPSLASPGELPHESPAEDSSRTPAEMNEANLTDFSVANSSETCLEPNNTSSDSIHIQKDIKDEEFQIASETLRDNLSPDLDHCALSDTKTSGSSDEQKNNVTCHESTGEQTLGSGTDEISQIENCSSASKSTDLSPDPDCTSPSVSNENYQDVAIHVGSTSEPSGSSKDIHSSTELEKDPLEKMTPNSSLDCHALNVTSDSLPNDISDQNDTSVTNNSEFSLKSEASAIGMHIGLEMGSPTEKETKNLSPNQDCGPMTTSDSLSTDTKDIISDPVSCLQPDTSDSALHPCPSKESTSSAKSTSTTPHADPDSDTQILTTDDKKQSISEGLESDLQPKDSNTDTKSCPEENTNSTSFPDQLESLHEHFVAQEPMSLSADVSDNARESFEEWDFSTQDQSEPGMLYGEPLSEDSLWDADEANPISGQHEETAVKAFAEDSMDQLEEPAPDMTFSGHMRRLLHPVVIMTTLESTQGVSSSYCCAGCQHTSHTVDHVIEHHYCSHPMLSFQYCKTCCVYLIRNEQKEKHLCFAIKKSPPVSSNPPKKRKYYSNRKCSKCELTFSKRVHFIKHMRGHTGKTPYRCNECGTYFSQSCSLRRHKSVPGRCKMSKQPDKNSDSVIIKTEPSPQKDVAHDILHENMKECYVRLIDISKKNLCHLCGKSFASTRKVQKHIYGVHKKKKLAVPSVQSTTNVSSSDPQKVNNEMGERYKCPLCPRVFKYTYNRSRHLRDCVRNATNGGQNKIGDKFVCPLCKTAFKSTSSRYKHIKTNCLREYIKHLATERTRLLQQTKQEKEVKPQSEENLPNTQLQESEPKQQELQVLAGPKAAPLYKCNHCPAVFRHASGKYRHMKKHELFKLTGKMFKYRNSVFSVMSNAETQSSTKTEESSNQSETVKENIRPTLSCRFCGKNFGIFSVKKHESTHRGERPYRCLECRKGFKKRAHLIGHRIVHQKRIQCTVCKKMFETVGELLQHRSSHLKRGKLQCPDCPAQYDFPVYLLRHLKTHENKEKKLRQLEVEAPLKPEQSLETAKKETAPKQRQCSLCEEVFDDAHVLRKHCLTHISSSNQCPFCKKSYPDRRNLLRHMNRHTGDKPFSCKNCGKQFYRSIYLRIHSEKCLPPHTGLLVKPESSNKVYKPYHCSICPRSFTKKDRWRTHLDGHKKNRLLGCSRCGQYFGKAKIAQHNNICRETEQLSTDDQSTANNSTKSSTQTSQTILGTPSHSNASKMLPFKCPFCPQKFRYRSMFLKHLVSHTGVQPYACMHCGQRFKSQTLCLKHEAFCDGVKNTEGTKPKSDGEEKMDYLREATLKPQPEGEPEHKCKFCTKAFLKPRNLRRHILTHTEVKPYRCKACDSCFSRYDHLKVHQVRCRGKKARLEVRIPKISLDDVGRGWQTKFDLKPTDKQETFDCQVCSKSFPLQSKLSRHFTMFHSVKPFKCHTCGSAFSHEKTLKAHRRIKRCRRYPSKASAAPVMQNNNQPAENAPKPFEIRKRILVKIQPVFNKRFKHVCGYCPRAFKNSWQLNVHLRLHTGEKPYSCEYCKERFIRKDYVLRHHLKCSKKFQRGKVLCDRCGGFFAQDNLENHKANCALRPSTCEYCGQNFLSKVQLVRHSFQCNKKSLHSDILCDRCGGFFPEDKLEDHKKGCVLKPSSSPVPKSQQSTPQSPPKGFSCAYCSSRFLLFSQLQEHFLSTHKVETMNPPMSTAPLQQLLSNIPKIKEEPVDESHEERLGDGANVIYNLNKSYNTKISPQFVCQKCNMCFTNKAGLAGHQRVHATETPFNCKMCNRGFWNRTLLRNHHRKCKSNAVQLPEGPLKAEIDFALKESNFALEDSETTFDEEVSQTNFPSKDESEEVSSQSSNGNQLQSHSVKEKKTVQYQCSECDKSFTDGLMLISHLEDHGREEQEKKQNICPKCGKVCSSYANLEKHMRIHEIGQKYNCGICFKGFPTVLDLEKHKSSHDPNKPFACKLCQQRFWTRPAVCEHYSTEHADDVFHCQFCSKAYAVKKSLVGHYKKWHAKEWKDLGSAALERGSSEHRSSSHVSTTGESDDDENDVSDIDSDSAPYFPCHVCGKTFPTSESLEDHQLCHLGEKPHECAECGKCFFQASQLQQHQRMHTSEYQCQTCGRGFVSLFALRNHKHNHGKSRPYRCSKCHMGFTGPTQLAEHMSTHREESFPCDICNKVFQSKISRAEHRKSHSKLGDDFSPSVPQGEFEQSESSFGYTTEFRYRCGICRDRFKDPEDLSEHGCMKAKERPYTCTKCNKHFLHASHLKKHMNNHQPTWSDTEYPCNQCNGSFSSSQHFLTHLQNHVDTSTESKSREEQSVSFICPICHQCFFSATELIHHFPTHPDNTPKRGKVLLDPSGSELEEHELLHPTSAAEYECTECGGSFPEVETFRRHRCSRQQQQARVESKRSGPTAAHYQVAGEEEEVDVTGEDLFKCNDCSMQFSSKSGLLEHQNNRHSNRNQFRCKYCGKTFAKMPYLKKHERRHLLKKLPNSVDEKKFKCSKCHEKFSTVQDLSLHMRLHAEEEAGEYRCDMCYKSFSKRSLLRHHQESHVGEVVYECTECDKAFAFPHLLEEHQQSHARSFE